MTALLVDSSTPTAAPVRRRGGGLWAAVRGSRKAMVGLAIFLVFAVLAAVPQLFTSVEDPNALEFQPGLGSSREHLLGTTALGQDIFAQLVYGTRQSLVIALVAGFFATVLSVMIGVSAAYLGGLSDEALTMLTNVFLVLPADHHPGDVRGEGHAAGHPHRARRDRLVVRGEPVARADAVAAQPGLRRVGQGSR